MPRHALRLAAVVCCHLAGCADDAPTAPEDAGIATPDMAPVPTYPPDGGDTSCGRATPLQCGESKAGANSAGANWINLYGCATAPNSGPESYYTFRSSQAQAVTVDLVPPDPAADAGVVYEDLDLFVLDATCGSATCLDRSIRGGKEAEQVSFIAEAHTDYKILVDGYVGGGSLGASEYQITATCATTQCPPSVATLDCSTTSLAGLTGQLGSTQKYNSYGCGGDTPEREVFYTFAPEVDGDVTVSLDIVEDWRDLDLFVLEDRGADCDVGSCLAASATGFDEAVTFRAIPGATYYVVVDGAAHPLAGHNVGAYLLSVTCPAPDDGGVADASAD